MHYSLISSLEEFSSGCLVLGIFDNPDFTEIPNKNLQQLLPKLCKNLEEAGDFAWQEEVDGCSIMLIHCGKVADFNTEQLIKRIATISTVLLNNKISQATLALPATNDNTPNQQLQLMLTQIDSNCYQLTHYKTLNQKLNKLDSIQFFLPKATNKAITVGCAIAAGVTLTKNLANLPANHCTPTILAQKAADLAKQHSKLQTAVFHVPELKKMGMGALLAVGQGSQEPPCFVELNYQGGNKESKPIVLVGKGITFDSGGISIKPSMLMDEMKYDMCGAATVLGTLHACALLNLPINVIGLIACAENLPSGSAVKPGDIVKSMSGQTIEILNTDAEGRLVLADALTYAERFKPEFVIDIATLTGAIIVALGNVFSGLMTSDEKIATKILQAAKESQDKVWRMPMDAAFEESLTSPLADMINASTVDRSAGSVIAATFLSRFTKKYPWAHLDIAGTAWVSGKANKATGRPVPLLIQLLIDAANES
jgi:leucyl aminopeptidase